MNSPLPALCEALKLGRKENDVALHFMCDLALPQLVHHEALRKPRLGLHMALELG